MRCSVRSVVAVVLTALIALAGCTSNQANTGSTGSTGAGGAKTDITVGIDVPFHPIFDYVMAKSADYFRDTPYTVSFKVLDATTQVPAFGRGDLDVITTVPSFMPIIQQQYGIDLTYFFPMARWTPGPQLLVAKDSPVTSIEQLAGKRVAIAPLSSRFGAEQAAVDAATGQTIKEYFQLSETDAAAQELTLGRVDAAFLEAPATAPLLEAGFRPVFSVQDAFQEAFGDPAVMNGGFMASKEFVADNPDFVKALVAATQDAWSTFQRDPATVLDTASQVSSIPTDQLELVAQVLNLAGTTDEQKKVTAQDVQTWSKIFPLLQRSGFTQSTPTDVAALFQITDATG
jgi:ABC-type nitrate/sulfonate/bicarbonate transport system substrate-binding protein